tara:strand:- start:612 stop:1523 length:912 start_codon:yes stop_codon:yes gene_type:complete
MTDALNNNTYELNHYHLYSQVENAIDAETLNTIRSITLKISPSYYNETNTKTRSIESRKEYSYANIKKTDNKYGVKHLIPTVTTNSSLLRSTLNKLTLKNYDKVREQITGILNLILDEEEIAETSNCIFDIASSNRFYSNLYARLFSELISEFSSMKLTFDKNFDVFLEFFNKIEFVDATENYNKFCEIAKENEKRKALSCFYVNLSEYGIIKRPQLETIILILINSVESTMNDEGKEQIVDEILENVCIIYKNQIIDNYHEIILNSNLSLLDFLTMIANSNSNDHKSLSQKSIFNIMDLLDV